MSGKEISSEEKIKAVKRFLCGEISQTAQAKELGINKRTFQDWIRKFERMGSEGFLERRQKNRYSSEVKESAVTEYLSGIASQAEICKKYGIADRKTLRMWISMYNGHKELRPGRGRGSDLSMTKGRNTTYQERVEIVSYCIEHGNDYTAAIEKYGVSYQQVYSWVRKYKEKGAEGLLDRRGKRKPESEMTELEKLRAENRMLEARNKRLETENAVLKKLEEIEGRWR